MLPAGGLGLYRDEAIMLHVHDAQLHAYARNEACIIIMTVYCSNSYQLEMHKWETVNMSGRARYEVR